MCTYKHHYQCRYSCLLYHDQQAEFHRLTFIFIYCTVYCTDNTLIMFVIALHKQMFFLSPVCFPPLTVPVTTREGVWRSVPHRPHSHDRFRLSHWPQVLVCCFLVACLLSSACDTVWQLDWRLIRHTAHSYDHMENRQVGKDGLMRWRGSSVAADHYFSFLSRICAFRVVCFDAVSHKTCTDFPLVLWLRFSCRWNIMCPQYSA